jgi:flagellar M-ring protein FliF
MAGLQKMVGGMVQENIRKALTPYLGLDNFEVSVAPQLSTDKRQIAETVYDPDKRAERSVRNVREKESSQNADRSAPTTVQQNLPDQQVNAGGTKNSNEEKQRREDVTNFEVSSKTTTTVSDGYSVKKLFVAVLINRARLVADLGDKTNQAIVDSKIAEISQLAATAGGLDRQRGDQIQVTAVDFVEGSRELAPVPPIGFVEMLNRQMGSFINAATILAVAAMLVWFGLRPAVNSILAHRAQQEQVEAAAAAASQLEGATMALADGEEAELNLVEDLEGKMQRTPQKRLEQIVRLDQMQAAAILKEWMRREEAA